MPDLERELTELTAEECDRLLATHHVGRVAFEADDLLHIVAMNYATDDDGRVVLRTGTGTLLYRASLGRVAFEIDGFDESTGTGWSVCVHGAARAVADGDPGTAALRALPLETWAPGGRFSWFVLHPRAVTGRRLAWREVRPSRWFSGNRMP